MDCYRSFASVYDDFMKGTPYKKWTDSIRGLWNKYSHEPKLVLELGCGTGTLTELFYKHGYDMIGLDSSIDMLSQAMRKKNAPKILYINQDMTSFELYGTVDSIICLCDGINYLNSTEEMQRTFKLAANYLNPEGMFIFDLNTEYFFANNLANNTFAQAKKNTAYIWQNTYDTEQRLNEYRVDFFIRNANGSYDRYEELHYEKAHLTDDVNAAISDSGLTLLEICDAKTLKEPCRTSNRLYFVTRR